MGSHQTLIHKSLMLPMAAALTEANAPHESWYSIKAAGRGVAEVLLYDEIGVWGITALQFARDLKAMGDLTKINLHIHSPGGDVFEGTAIYNLLRNHPASVDVYIDGLAASMASVIAMAGDTIYMPENAMMMVHKPWGIRAAMRTTCAAMPNCSTRSRTPWSWPMPTRPGSPPTTSRRSSRRRPG